MWRKEYGSLAVSRSWLRDSSIALSPVLLTASSARQLSGLGIHRSYQNAICFFSLCQTSGSGISLSLLVPSASYRIWIWPWWLSLQVLTRFMWFGLPGACSLAPITMTMISRCEQGNPAKGMRRQQVGRWTIPGKCASFAPI